MGSSRVLAHELAAPVDAKGWEVVKVPPTARGTFARLSVPGGHAPHRTGGGGQAAAVAGRGRRSAAPALPEPAHGANCSIGSWTGDAVCQSRTCDCCWPGLTITSIVLGSRVSVSLLGSEKSIWP